MNPGIVVAVVVALVIVVAIAVFAFNSSAPPQRPTYTAPPPQPTYRAPVVEYSPPPVIRSTQAIQSALQRQLGAAWLAQERETRAQVLAQEKKIIDRLRYAKSVANFEELKGLHRQSYQTANYAKRVKDQAEASERSLGASLRSVKQALRQEQQRGGYNVETFKRSVDAANQDWVLISQFANEYRADLDRLNKATGTLRDNIRDNCGLPGRQWYDALMQRTHDRRNGLL
jgi:hypothetical protein